MDNCPYCGAPGGLKEAVDGCCYVCGMVLEDESGKPAASGAPPEAATATVAATAPPPPAAPPTIVEEETDVPAINLIQPRHLGPEYARRVTAAWQATKSPFRNPFETLNSSSIAGSDPKGLLIGSRSVSNLDDDRHTDYELTEVIGEGNMGTVWSARQASLDRQVALKMPKPSASESTLGREQFISEVVVTGQLDHPNIVPIYDLARDESGQLFYAMKRVEGRPWDQVMHEAGRTRQENIEVLMKVCDAIRFAHDRGVIHRDIKPQNIMVGKYGEVAVMDWGIALRFDADTRMSSITRLSPAGTPAYMAPEMATANAGEIGSHTDVYLLGAVLYEIITGEPPHPPPKDTHERIVQQNACLLIAAQNVISPAQETGELVDIAYKAMATDISNRYQTVDEFQDAIRAYLSHAESIALADRGDNHLAKAIEMQNGSYEDYARARFAFDEAVQLWPDNARARKGLDDTTLRYADTAYQRGDYALGLSLLDQKNPDHAELRKKLSAAQRKWRRNRFVAVASAVAAACFLIAGIGVSSIFAIRESSAKEKALLAEAEATRERDRAVDEETKANEQRARAEAAEFEAKKERDNALTAEELATKERDTAMAAEARALDAKNAEEKQRERAEQASYRSEVGLAAEELQRNSFDAARDILEQQEDNATQAALRNWEWGHLMYLADAPAVDPFASQGSARVEAVALSPDQRWIAAGTDDGKVQLWWRADPEKPALQVATPLADHDARVTALAVSPDNRLLAIAAGNEVRFWGLPAGGPEQAIQPVGAPLRYPGRILSVAFAPNANTVLTSADDSTAQLWSRSEPERPRQLLAGHLTGPVWQARFSPDGKRIVTAGDDNSVRMWNAENGTQERSFEGHRGPVYTADFSPDGNYVISAGRDRRLLVWDLAASAAALDRRDVILARLQSTGHEEFDSTGGVRSLGEHGAPVRSVSFSPTGNVLYSASEDNSIGVWDVSQGIASGKLLKSLRGHGGWVRSCAAGADGQHVLSGSYDGRVYLWDWSKYAFPRVLRPDAARSLSAARFTSAASSPDAHWIATAAENGVVTIWDMSDPLNPVSQALTEGHDWQATTGVFFDGGSRLLTAGGDNAALVWDARRGNQLLRIGGWNVEGGTGWRGVAAASTNGQWIATGSDRVDDADTDETVLAKIWDATTGQRIASLAVRATGERSEAERPEATAIAFSPDDRTLFVGDQFGNCYLFDTAGGALRSSFLGHSGKISAARFLPDGRLLTASSDGNVARWNLRGDLANLRPELQLPHRDRVAALDVSSDGNRLITAADSQDSEAVLRVWSIESGGQAPAEISRLTLAELTEQLAGRGAIAEGGKDTVSVRSVAFHPSQPQAVITVYDPNSAKYHVANWQWTAQNPIQLISSRLGDTSAAIYAREPEGAVLTVGGRGARLRLANQETVMSYRPQESVLAVSFSPDSGTLACAGSDGSIKVWRYAPAENKWRPDQKLFEGHSDAVTSVAFHPLDSNILVSAGSDGRARLWNRGPEGWAVATTLEPEDGARVPLRQAIFTPLDENQDVEIITAATDGGGSRITIWSPAGQAIRAIRQSGPIQSVAVSPDGKWIVSGVDSEVWVWSRQSTQAAPRTTLRGHSAEVTSLAFSPDGQRLFTASRDRNIKLWDTSSWDAGEESQRTSRELLTLEGHTDAVNSVSYYAHPNYPSLLTAGADGQAILWPTVAWQ